MHAELNEGLQNDVKEQAHEASVSSRGLGALGSEVSKALDDVVWLRNLEDPNILKKNQIP
ncbi:unnamed protein product [Prunus armeniaca]|uniref:Uncharacterized protein n=1 Tax=Prunus armeniaca TaxID=36596 RepID=A0A6J5U626_PRUAR|nr:unnamed protein product [Prunus armeniaca]